MLPGLSFFVCSGGRNLRRRRAKPVGRGEEISPAVRRPPETYRGTEFQTQPRVACGRTSFGYPLAKTGGSGYNKRVAQVSLLC